MHQSEVTPSSPSREGSYDPYLTDNTGLAEAVFLIGGNQPVIMISPIESVTVTDQSMTSTISLRA